MPRTLSNTITFTSPHGGLRLVRKSAETVTNPTLGTVSITAPEVVYEFRSGTLEIPPNTDVLPDLYNPETGEWETRDAIEYLRSHPEYDIRFIESKPVIPDPGPVYAAILDATLAGDMDAIQAIGDEEFATWKRPEVMDRLKTAADALDPPKTKG